MLVESEESAPTIDRDPDQDERESERDEERGLVQGLLALERRRPAHDPRPEEHRPRSLRAYRPAVADEEAGDEHERADEVEPDREGPPQRPAADETGEDREHGRHADDSGQQHQKAA